MTEIDIQAKIQKRGGGGGKAACGLRKLDLELNWLKVWGRAPLGLRSTQLASLIRGLGADLQRGWAGSRLVFTANLEGKH